MVSLEPLPDTLPFRILVGGPVRKNPRLVRHHLESIATQTLPLHVTLTPAYIDDNRDPASSELLKKFCEERHGYYLRAEGGAQGEYADSGITHTWDGMAMRRVAEHKNHLIRLALDQRFDALWLVDADLLLSPRTLWSLYYSDVPVACGVFWTKWQDTPDCPPAPQVWLRHPYELSGRGMSAEEFLRLLHQRQRVRVWGQGACTLYRADALAKGLNFDFIPELPTWGMWPGEDRHLCTRAERLYIPMWADAWPDVWHCYHPKDVELGIAWFTTERPETERPGLGDLVSITLEGLEPVPHQDGSWTKIPAQHVRGILGKLPLAPDLEAEVREMRRGEQRIVSVEFPSWADSPFRGGRRLIQVMLLDHKPNQPVVNG